MPRPAAPVQTQTITIARARRAGRTANGNSVYEIIDTANRRWRTAANSTAGMKFPALSGPGSLAGRQAKIAVNSRGTISDITFGR